MYIYIRACVNCENPSLNRRIKKHKSCSYIRQTQRNCMLKTYRAPDPPRSMCREQQHTMRVGRQKKTYKRWYKRTRNTGRARIVSRRSRGKSDFIRAGIMCAAKSHRTDTYNFPLNAHFTGRRPLFAINRRHITVTVDKKRARPV